MLNHIDSSLNIKTDEVSYALGRGKHTTRHTEFLNVLDGLIADTPGFSALDFNELTVSDIRDNFIEFENYKEYCKYQDCMHNDEEDCYVKQMVTEKKF